MYRTIVEAEFSPVWKSLNHSSFLMPKILFKKNCSKRYTQKKKKHKKTSYLSDHVETIKSCVNSCRKMSSNCEIEKERGGLSKSGDGTWGLGACQFTYLKAHKFIVF